MTKPTAQKIAQYRAIATRKAGAAADPVVAANDDAAPKAKGTLKLADIVATVEFDDVKIAETVNGKPYMTFKDATVRTDDGEVTRTVMAFESYDLVRQVVTSCETLVATLAKTGSTMKIVGVMIDGAMTMAPAPLAKAA